MKVKLQFLVNSAQSLRELGNLDNLESPLDFKIAQLLNVTQVIFKNFEVSQKKIFKRFMGEVQDDGSYIIPPKYVSEYNIESNALMNEEVDIVVPEIKVGQVANKGLKPKDIAPLLLWLIKE